MLFAQALGEYGAAAAVTTAFSRTWTSAELFVTGIEPSAWLVVGIGVVLLLFMRRPS